jgi:hypothetical protein
MSQKQRYNTDRAVQVMHDKISSSGGDATAYSDKFGVSYAEVWNTHFEWDETAATFAAAITLWASNKASPDESTDTDWVNVVTAHGFSGLPGSDPAGGDGRDMVDVSASGALWYRWKVVRASGTATIQAYVSRKDLR